MPISNIFIINRAGSLIYDWDNRSVPVEVELKFASHPIDFKLELVDNRLSVAFGERENVRYGHVVTAVNDEAVGLGGKLDKSNQDFSQVLEDPGRFPLTVKFVRPSLNTNEKIILSSMFHSLHAIASQLSPVSKSSGIESLDTDTYKLQCFQSITGLKFVAVADHGTANLDQLLNKLYELYADYASKNPFYSLEMPVRCELFDQHLKAALDKFDRASIVNV